MTITSDTIVYHGFAITPTYQSSATRRTCSTVQAYIVTHPKGGDGSPCGWRKSIRSAKEDIDDFVHHSKFCADELAAMDIANRYLERMALWFPSSAASDALAIRTDEAKAKAAAQAKADAERVRVERVRDAATDMLAALRAVVDAGSQSDDVRAMELARAAIAKAEGNQ